MRMRRPIGFVVIAVAVLLWLVLGLLGGATNRFDSRLVLALGSQRSAEPALTHAALALTTLGGATATLSLGLAAAVALAARGRPLAAAQLSAVILSGRLLVDLLKLVFDRARPGFEAHPVLVHSASFPSGHSANSMITFLAVALFLAPAAHRPIAVVAAVGASLVVGATRVVLGVHWPSDVLAGWLLGLAWAAGWHWLCDRSAVR